MDWKDIKGIIGKAAPLVGTLLGGPAGAAVGGIISTALGVEDTPDAVANELKNNPEALLKLKQYEITHEEKLQEMHLETLKANLADVQNARNRQIKQEEATGKTDVNLYVLTWVIVIGFFGLIGILIFHALPEGQNNIVYMLFGTLSAGFGAVMQYFYGTSKGSSDKTKYLVDMHKSPTK